MEIGTRYAPYIAPPIYSSHDPWQGKVDGNTGLVPANYIRVIEDVAVFDTEDDIQSSVCYIAYFFYYIYY